MNDSVKEATGVDFYACATDEEARELAKSLKMELKDKTATRGKLVAEAFDAFVEETLVHRRSSSTIRWRFAAE